MSDFMYHYWMLTRIMRQVGVTTRIMYEPKMLKTGRRASGPAIYEIINQPERSEVINYANKKEKSSSQG